MLESLLTTLDQFTHEILVVLSGLLVITTTLFMWLWFANRRTYQMLKHQIPASVVKTYLDSIIQNSNSLKSQLFRGGGADLSGLVPSVLPAGGLGGGENIMVAPAGGGGGGAGDAALREQLSQRLAEIASLQSQLSAANGVKKELEGGLESARARIKELEALLAKAGTSGGADPALTAELQKVSRERDELRERLKEYEIIEDDLANLKRLQQENQQLRKALESQGGSLPVAPVDVPSPAAPAAMEPLPDIFEAIPPEAPSIDVEAAATAELEKFLTPQEPAAAAAPEDEISAPADIVDAPLAVAEVAEVAEATEAAEGKNAAPEGKNVGEKTPEDLLSEFEKMLG